MNLYAYVGGDPVNYVDPLGLKGEVPDGYHRVKGCRPGEEAVPMGDWLVCEATRPPHFHPSPFGDINPFDTDGALGVGEAEGELGTSDDVELCETFSREDVRPGSVLDMVFQVGRQMEEFRNDRALLGAQVFNIGAAIHTNRFTGELGDSHPVGYSRVGGQRGGAAVRANVSIFNSVEADVFNTVTGGYDNRRTKWGSNGRRIPARADLFISNGNTATLVGRRGEFSGCNLEAG
jgi:hypothetical protein